MLKNFLIFSVLAIAIIAGGASAQVYIKKEQTTQSKTVAPQKLEPNKSLDLKSLQDAEPIPEEKEAAPAPAPELTIKQHANTYFQNCMQSQDPILQGELKELMCGCTSSKIPEVMTVEQYKAMATDTEEGLHQRNRMMMFIYTPCIEFPTRALIMNSCTQQATLRKPQKTCECIADGMAEYMNEKAPIAIRHAIERNKKNIDPLRELLESKGYQQMERYHLKNCIFKHEQG